MKTKPIKPIVYLVVALMLATSITYLVVAVEESSEIGSTSGGNNENRASNTSSNENDNSNERVASNAEGGETVTAEAGEALSAQIETTFFAVASAGYLVVGVWMLKKKENSKIPYVIAIIGSLSLIVLYVVSRMVSLPIVGLQEDMGFVDILSKILQSGIIAGCVYILMSYRRSITKGMATISR